MKRILATTAVAVLLAAGAFAGGEWWANRSGAAHVERSGRNRLHLPDAPGLPQRSSGQLPDLRHAPRGGSGGRGSRETTPPFPRCRPARCR